MITYEDIKKANESIKTIDVKGKDYASVAQRIKAFRTLYPEGFIETEMLSNENGFCLFKAKVGYFDKDKDLVITLGTGTAYEKEGSSFINKTSYIENCETSAVGRALGMAGLGIDIDVASFEEVKNAELNSAQDEKINDVTLKALEARCKNDGVDVEALCKLYKVKGLADLTNKKHANIHEHWDKITLMNKGGSNE